MIKINGIEESCAKGMTIMEYLNSKGYRLGFIAIELNGKIIPKSEYESRIISESDTMEIVSFVGGG